MRIVSHKRLKEFYETKGREDSRVALERWYDMAEKAEWKNLSDIKVDFPATDYMWATNTTCSTYGGITTA